MSCGDSGVGNFLGLGKDEMEYLRSSLIPEQKCASVKANSICVEKPVHPRPLIKPLNRTPHLIITSRHSHRRGQASSWGQKHHTPPQRTLLRANYTGPHHSEGLVKLDSLCFSGLWMNLSNLNFPSLPSYFFLDASCQAEWGAIPFGVISQRHTMQSNFIPPHSITMNSVSQGQ